MNQQIQPNVNIQNHNTLQGDYCIIMHFSDVDVIDVKCVVVSAVGKLAVSGERKGVPSFDNYLCTTSLCI